MRSQLISSGKSVSAQGKKAVAAMMILLLSSALVYSQPSPPGPGGGNPDTPLGVPFSDHMNLLLLLAGIVFAVVILKRMQKKKHVTGSI